MIKSSSLEEFGSALKMIRLSHNYSTYYVNEKTGIKRETISKIEKGLTIPRYDTLDLLSILYKVNLHLLFEEKRTVSYFTVLYNRIDELIISFDIDEISKLREEYKVFKANQKSKAILEKSEVDKFEVFIDLIIKHYDEKRDVDKCIDEILKIIINKENPTINDILEKQYFDLLDLRIIIILASFLRFKKDYTNLTQLLELVISKVSDEKLYPVLSYKMHIKAAHNLSYAFNIIQQYDKSLFYADYGIELLNLNDSKYFLGHLLGRKCIAEIKLGKPKKSIYETFYLMLFALKLQNEIELMKTFLDVFENKYGITIENDEIKAMLYSSEKLCA